MCIEISNRLSLQSSSSHERRWKAAISLLKCKTHRLVGKAALMAAHLYIVDSEYHLVSLPFPCKQANMENVK